MSGYIGNIPVPQATQTRQTFTATASQTSFATGGYQAGYLDVFLNGVKLVDGTDYTATNGSDVVLTTGAASGDILEVVAYTAFTVADQAFTGDTSIENLDVTGSFTSQGIDDNATSTAMTLDASGNVLVGTTSIIDVSTSSVTGFDQRSTGVSVQVRDGGTVQYLNRLTSDGTIIDFRKDGSTVGSIGTNSNRPYFEKDAAGGFTISSSGGNPIILPTSGAGALSDSLANIGAAAYRFKDLYLSGGVYLGGTGSANKLDDYEEGTWTPTYVPSGTNFSSITYNTTFTKGTYTKIGNTVVLRGYIRTEAITAGSASGHVRIGGLPFTSSSGVNEITDTRSRGACTGDNFASNAPSIISINQGSLSANLYRANPIGAATSHLVLAPSDMATNTAKNITTFTLAYVTDA